LDDIKAEAAAFKELATDAFHFLVKEFGFQPVKSEGDSVRYQSAKVYVNISLGRVSKEIRIEIGLLPGQYDQVSHSFGLDEIIESMDNRNEIEYLYFQGETKEQLQKNLPFLAGLVKKYAGDVLRGDYLVIQNLERLRSDSSLGLGKPVKIRQTYFD